MAEIKTQLTDAELGDPEYMRAYVEEMHSVIASLLEAAVLSANAGKVDAETYLRDRYGAYKGHFAWRELEEAFNAGRAPTTQQASDAGRQG